MGKKQNKIRAKTKKMNAPFCSFLVLSRSNTINTQILLTDVKLWSQKHGTTKWFHVVVYQKLKEKLFFGETGPKRVNKLDSGCQTPNLSNLGKSYLSKFYTKNPSAVKLKRNYTSSRFLVSKSIFVVITPDIWLVLSSSFLRLS